MFEDKDLIKVIEFVRNYHLEPTKGLRGRTNQGKRSKLFNKGIRFRVHANDIPGKPDIVIKKYKLAIEIKG